MKASNVAEASALPEPRFLLLTGRTIYQGVGKEKGKLSEEYLNSVAICEMDPEDMKLMKIKENRNVRVTNKFGSVVVRAVKSMRAPHLKTIFIPYGPWASLVMNPKTDGTGMPSLKGVPAKIESAPEERILNVVELLETYYRKE